MSFDPVSSEALLRLAMFVGVLLLLLLAQWRWPFRGDACDLRRALRNGGLLLLGSGVLRLLFPLLAVGWAIVVEQRGHGLFNQLDWPPLVEIASSILLLDLAIYWQHRLLHRIPWGWRLHRVHHSDVAFDVTTGVRFHPLEIGLSMAIKLGLVWLLGAPALAVLAFEILLSAGALFTHADIALPARLDRRLRWLLVTPSMHRIHHSVLRNETDSNYGFHLSVWDRLFRSYRALPAGPERTMPIGVGAFDGKHEQSLPALLLQPFKRDMRRKEPSDA